MDYSKKIFIYQLFTRLFGNKKSLNKTYGTMEENGVGKFNDITEKALFEIKTMGITHIWYTGIIEHATMTDFTSYGIPRDNSYIVKGIAGSPYAIKDYYDVNPELAEDVPNRMKEFELLIKRTHQAGLKVIIDFIPNHVSRVYKSDSKPEGIVDFGVNDDKESSYSYDNNFYYLNHKEFIVPEDYKPPLSYSEKYKEYPAKVTGNNIFSERPSIYDWYETIKLNYGIDFINGETTHKRDFNKIPDTWLKLRDILRFWAEKGVDGFRCDMAEMAPVQFWKWVICDLKAYKSGTIFIAEIYNPEAYENYIYEGGFDYLYDKAQMYDTIRDVMIGNKNADSIFQATANSNKYSERLLNFLENHDEQRIASKYFAGDPFRGIPGFITLSTISKASVMVYFGQETGEPGEGIKGFSDEDGRTTIFDYWGVPAHQKWMNNGNFDGGLLDYENKKLRELYCKILNIALKSKAINSGDTINVKIEERGLSYDLNRIAAFIRRNEEESILVIVNFDERKTINCPVSLVKESINLDSKEIILESLLTGKTEIMELMGDCYKGNIMIANNSGEIFVIKKCKI